MYPIYICVYNIHILSDRMSVYEHASWTTRRYSPEDRIVMEPFESSKMTITTQHVVITMVILCVHYCVLCQVYDENCRTNFFFCECKRTIYNNDILYNTIIILLYRTCWCNTIVITLNPPIYVILYRWWIMRIGM